MILDVQGDAARRPELRADSVERLAQARFARQNQSLDLIPVYSIEQARYYTPPRGQLGVRRQRVKPTRYDNARNSARPRGKPRT